MEVKDLVAKVKSKKYFNAEVEEEVLSNFGRVFEKPLAERTQKDNLLRDVLMHQIAISVYAQYSDREYEQEQKDTARTLGEGE